MATNDGALFPAMLLLLLLLAVGAVEGGYNWDPVVWGGGGYVTGIVFHPAVEGLVYARTDVGGAYRRDPGSRTWRPILNAIAREDVDLYSIWSLAVDAGDADRVYVAAGMYTADWGRTAAVLRSADRGRTWARTELPFRLGGNEAGRGSGERLQVDPHLGSVVYLGTARDGLWRSADAGATWARVPSCPAAAVTFVLLDAVSGRPGRATPRIYVGDAAGRLLVSTDAGASWGAVRGQPRLGQIPLAAAADGAGRVYLAYSNGLGPNGVTNGSVHVYDHGGDGDGGGWADISPEPATWFGYAGVSVSARSPSIVAVTSLDRWYKGDQVWRSLNGGRHWTPLEPLSTHAADDAGAGWMRHEPGAMGHWITDVEIDPFAENHVLYNHGLGVWETDAFLCARCPWRFAVDGLEETCVTSMAAPASADAMLFVTAGDVGGGRYGRNRTDLLAFPQQVTTHGVDYAHWWPNFMARTADTAAMAYLSWDNGRTWRPVPSRPVDRDRDTGRVAVASNGGSLLWAVPGHGAWASTDHGNAWAPSAGYPVSVDGRFFAPVADRTTDGFYYTYDYGRGQLLESADSGRTFAPVYTGLDVMPSYRSRHQLVSFPTVLRDLWLATPHGLYRFPGRTAPGPVRVDGVAEAYGVAYGAAAPGRGYPTVYVSAKIAGVTGLFRSEDVGKSWTRIDDDQHRWLVDQLVGDPRVFGRVFVAPAGRGVLQGTPA